MNHQITLERKMKAMREVQRIYDLAKKWQRPVGHTGKMPNFSAMADSVMRKAMRAEVEIECRLTFATANSCTSDSRTARVIERTLKNGIIHPDVLHSFQSGRSKQPARQDHTIGRDLAPDPSLTDFDLFVQHSDYDLDYPSHFVPGEGFIPRTHVQESHTQLAHAGQSETEQVPTQQGTVRPQAGLGYS